MARIIFLDIDGVLNGLSTTTYAQPDTMMPGERGFTGMDPIMVASLNRVLRETGAVIVVSSTWRLGQTAQSMQAILGSWGVECQVLGVTPSSRTTRRPDG